MAHRRERSHQPEDHRGLNIGGTNVPKGNYTIYTLPGSSSWQLIINKQTGQWGTEYDQRAGPGAHTDEGHTASLRPGDLHHLFDKTGGNAGAMKLEWENTIASVDVKEAK